MLVEKLREKQAHPQKPVRSIASTPSRQNVINLMDALKRSLATERPTVAICTTRLSGFETSGRQTVVASVAQGKLDADIQ